MGLSSDPKAKAICPTTGKERLSKGDAKSTAKRAKGRDYGNITAYRCRACRGWHVGNERKFG